MPYKSQKFSFTPEQLNVLHQYFNKVQLPKRSEKLELGRRLHIDPILINKWFHYQRIRLKNHSSVAPVKDHQQTQPITNELFPELDDSNFLTSIVQSDKSVESRSLDWLFPYNMEKYPFQHLSDLKQENEQDNEKLMSTKEINILIDEIENLI